MERIESLKTDPFPRQAIKLSDTERLYRIRVGDYRVIYKVEKKVLLILVVRVGHRREVYRRLVL